MKDKIIFWLDSELLSYSLAYYLQKNLDSELYAIIDITNISKKFFQEQNLVEFQKTWFYFDNVRPNNKPDINYLKNIEKKYNIDLWQLAINERIFYKYNTFHHFTNDEILSILEQECRLFETIINEIKPAFFITKETIQHKDYLFYKMCRSAGIKVLVCYEPVIGYKCVISQEEHKLDFSEDLSSIESKNRSFEDLQNYFKSFNKSKQVIDFRDKYRSSNSDRFKAAIKYILFSNNKNIQTHYTYYGRSKLRVLFSEFGLFLKRKYREQFMSNNLEKEINKNEKFIYFPLHIDQERSLLISAPYYTNQIEMLRSVAKSIPMGYTLYVKEHPSQANRNWRSVFDYKEIMDIPNVRLFHPSFPATKLYRNCSLIITVGGASGFEASLHGKPTILFGDMGYSILPSVTKADKFDNLSEIIRESLLKQVDPADVERYVTLLEKNSIDFDWSGMSMEILDRFFYGGHFIDVDISTEMMKSFLNQHQNEFEKLVSGLLSKIEQFKNEG